MSLYFNDTTTRKGIIQSLERKLGFNPGDISGSTSKMLDFTAEINTALDYTLACILDAGGKWQFDDTNFDNTTGGYPIIKRNLVSGTRDYTFNADGYGNLILEIFRVFVMSPSGVYQEVFPIDVQSDENTEAFTDGRNVTGVPQFYDKTANGIFFDIIPNYSQVGGIMIYIDREATYFTVSDTTKRPGFAGLFHEFLAIRVAYNYAFVKTLPSVNISELKDEMISMKGAIEAYYGSREKDVRPILSMEQINFL